MRWGILVFALLGLTFVAAAQEREEAPPSGVEAPQEADTPPAGETGESGEAEAAGQEEEPAPKEEKKPAPQGEPVKERLPGPEHQKLHYFEGTWKGDLTLKASMFRDESKTTSEAQYRKILKGFFMEYDYVQKPSKAYPEAYAGRGILNWDAEAKAYRMAWYDSIGKVQVGHGQWKGDELAFHFDLHWGGKDVKQVITYSFVSETQYNWKMENGYADQPLRTVIVAEYTKQ